MALQRPVSPTAQPQSGRCLDVSNHSATDGPAVHLWTCLSAANQRWTLS
ncbi:RICIN domain-containing protein [Micromonospora rifamycinica]